jgi:plasmid replication initiation protein
MPAVSFLFLLRKPEGKRIDERRILLRVTVDKKRAEYATKVRVRPEDWDVTRHRLTGDSQAVADFNQVLHNLHAKALHTKDTLETAGHPVTAAAIVAALRNGVQATAVAVEPGPLFPQQRLTTTLTLVDDSDERNKRRGNMVAFQHNNLVRAPYRMGVLESRIFVEALRGINHGPDGDTTLPPIDISLSAVIGSNDGADNYADVRQACKDLFNKSINLEPVGARKGENYHRTRIVSDIELLAGTGRIRGTFAPLMQPYLLQLTTAGNFTRADIATLLTLSPNAQRLYWYLKSYANLGEGRTVTHSVGLDQLKLLLLNDAALYPIYAEFVRRVLEPIRLEFHALTVAFPVEWEGTKTGKKTTGIKFTIPKAQPQLAAAPVATVAAAAQLTATARPDRFALWLAGQGEKLRAAYAGLTSSNGASANHLAPAVAQRIIKHVASKPELEKVLFATRHRIATTKEAVKDKASYSYKQLTTALGKDFR